MRWVGWGHLWSFWPLQLLVMRAVMVLAAVAVLDLQPEQVQHLASAPAASLGRSSAGCLSWLDECCREACLLRMLWGCVSPGVAAAPG